MLIRRRHKLHALRLRRLQSDEYEPEVLIGPVFLRYPHRDDCWRQEDQLPRRRIGGRWLPARWASKRQWLSSINCPGSRRGDPRITKQQKAAERCGLYRYTSCPF